MLKPTRILVYLTVPSVYFVKIGFASTINASIVTTTNISTKSNRSCYRSQFFSPILAPPVSPTWFLVVALPSSSLSHKCPPESPLRFLVCSVSILYSHDLVVGLFIRFSLPHLRLFSIQCRDPQGWVILPLFPSPCCIHSSCLCLISWLGCSRFSLLHVASLFSQLFVELMSSTHVLVSGYILSFFTIRFCSCICSFVLLVPASIFTLHTQSSHVVRGGMCRNRHN